jgi:hypothetical protein
MILDAYIEKVDSIKDSQWQKLFDFIPLIEQSSIFGEWTDGGIKENGYYSIPQCKYAPIVSDFERSIYTLELQIDFDWENWFKGVALLDDEKTDYASLDALTLLKLITLIVKSEGLNEGYLLDCFKYGLVLKILKGLREKVESDFYFDNKITI